MMNSRARRGIPRSFHRLWLVASAIALVASAAVGGAIAQAPTSDGVAVPLAHLAPGDDVIVIVFREKDLSGRAFVDERSQLALPRLALLDVGHLTADMLRDTIRARYASFLRDPSVDVRALRRVTVNGSVLKPDVYFVDPSMMLRDVIARAGGITPDGNVHGVSLVRGNTSLRYPEWSETSEGQTALRSGDEIVVARRSWVSLNVGAVVGIVGLLTSLLIAFRR